MTKQELALETIKRLKAEYPDTDCTLEYDQAWKLLVSVRLAAQCTDARVNVVVEKLFADYTSIEALASAEPEEIEKYITATLHRGATELHGEGAYTHEGRTVLLTVMKRHEAVLLRRYVRQVDPNAFVLIINTGEIVGNGFRSFN